MQEFYSPTSVFRVLVPIEAPRSDNLSDCYLRVTAIHGTNCLPTQWRTVGDRNHTEVAIGVCVCVCHKSHHSQVSMQVHVHMGRLFSAGTF